MCLFVGRLQYSYMAATHLIFSECLSTIYIQFTGLPFDVFCPTCSSSIKFLFEDDNFFQKLSQCVTRKFRNH